MYQHNTVAGNVRSYPTYARQGRIHNYCWYCYSLRKWLNPAHTHIQQQQLSGI